MRMFDVQGIEIRAPRGKVFEFVLDPGNLPQWAHAFTSAGDGQAGSRRRQERSMCGSVSRLMRRPAL